MADNHQLAITWNSRSKILQDCSGHTLTTSDQGILFREYYSLPPVNRRKRQIEDTSQPGIVTSDLLASELQALADNTNNYIRHTFKQIISTNLY